MLDDYENYIGNGLGNIEDDVTRTTHKKSFNELLKEAQQELYSGCSKFSKLSFIVKLLHLKVYKNGAISLLTCYLICFSKCYLMVGLSQNLTMRLERC